MIIQAHLGIIMALDVMLGWMDYSKLLAKTCPYNLVQLFSQKPPKIGCVEGRPLVEVDGICDADFGGIKGSDMLLFRGGDAPFTVDSAKIN
jgi:hypothetical protein